MAATKVGLVYSKATVRLRSFLVPDDDQELLVPLNHPGEALLIVTKAQAQAAAGPDGLQALVNAHTGKVPINDRYAVVHNLTGKVIAESYLCPACGDVAQPGHSIVQHATVGPGWTYLAGVFTPPVVVVRPLP